MAGAARTRGIAVSAAPKTQQDACAERADQLQERLLSYPGIQAESEADLLRQLRNYLRQAIEDETLQHAPEDLYQLVKKMAAKNRDEFLIVGGDKNEQHDPNLPSLRRADGSFFHFTLTCRQKSREPVELLGYNFELCFAAAPNARREYVRFDLTSPTGEATANIERGMRSHLHPGSDDIQVPAAALTPIELLDLCVYRLKPRDSARRRAS